MPDKRLTQLQFNRQLWRAVVPPLLLLTAHAVLISLLFLSFVRASDWARKTDLSTAAINDLERHLVNMETGFRGYLLLGDEEFLQPYHRSRGRINQAFDDLDAMFDDASNPTQQARLNDIRALYAEWTAREPTGERTLRDGPIEPATAAKMIARKKIMDDMRRKLQEMLQTEMSLRQGNYQKEQRATTTAVIGGIGVLVAAGIALALINRQTVHRLSAVYQRLLDHEAAANQQFIELAESVPQLIWITDADGKHLYFNRPWSEFTGVISSDASRWETALHPEESDVVAARWQGALAKGEPFEGQYRLKRASDGTYRWFLCRAIPVFDKDKKRTRWFGSCTDIEEQKRAEREREAILAAERAARSDLLRSSRIKDEFLATLSHEMRTPMTAILGWSRLLRDPAIRAKSLDRALEAIDSNARAQARLIDDLLDMSRIASGKLTLKPEQVDLIAVIRAAVDSVTPAAVNKKIAISTSFPPVKELYMQADAARLQQVIWNLLSNAVKFTPTGGRVSVSLAAAGEHARVSVSDTGRGIKPGFLPHVFERFRQADGSTTRQYGGLGLGLAIVKHLVEMHGGTVSAASDGEDKGATFTIDLPLSQPMLLEDVTPLRTHVDLSALEGKQVLVVEDDPDTSMIVRIILENAGCAVTTANSGLMALELWSKQRFDALISDIGMPEMDGYSLIKRIRELQPPDQPPLPAMSFSAFARAEDRAAALSAGYQFHLTKPVAPEELLSALAGLVSVRG